MTVKFEDAQGDVQTVNFGVVGESSHYELVSEMAAGQTSGSLLLALYPKNYAPGYYELAVSLTDEAGNTSASKTAAFIILNADGTLPDQGTGGSGGAGGAGGSGGATPSLPTMLLAYDGDEASGEAPALVKVHAEQGEPQIAKVTELLPLQMRSAYMDLRGGRLAMTLDDSVRGQVPAGRGHVVALDLSAPTSPWFAPSPTAEPDYHYTVANTRPQVLPDGRVVYVVVHQTDNQYDDYHGPQLAVWDPETDPLELQGLLTDFVLSQPEVQSCECDAEGGALGGEAMAASQQGRYVYFSAYALGTDMGVYHQGPYLLGRYEVQQRTTERMFFTETQGIPWAVSGDGAHVAVSWNGHLQLLDPVAKTMNDYDPWPHEVLTGQMSSGDAFIKGWRACEPGAYGGVVRFDASGAQAYRIVDGEQLQDGFRGLQNLVQITRDGSKIYFLASSDACTNYASQFAIYEAPVEEDATAKAVKLMELGPSYDNSTFVLVQ